MFLNASHEVCSRHNELRELQDVLVLASEMPLVMSLALKSSENIYWVNDGNICAGVDFGQLRCVFVKVWLVPKITSTVSEDELGGELFQ